MHGIPELPAEAFTLREGAFYCGFSPALRDAVPVLSRILESSKRGVFAADCLETELFSELGLDVQTRLINAFTSAQHTAYFWHSAPAVAERRDLATLLSECQRLHVRKNTMLVVAISAFSVANGTEKQRSNQIKQWAKWARAENITVLLLIYGHYESLRPTMIKECNHIAGMLSLLPVSHQQIDVCIHYWCSAVDVIADREFLLARAENGHFAVIDSSEQHTSTETTTAVDEGDFYIAAPALLGADQRLNNHAIVDAVVTRSFRDNHQLMDSITHLDAATVVFSCSVSDDARDVAVMCYKLRTKYGGRPKLVVREVRPCLRYADTRFLLRGGVSLVVPHSIAFSDFLDQIDALQGQVMIRSLPASLSSMLEAWKGVTQRGYFEPQEFVRYAQLALDASRQTDLDLVLLILTPAETLAIEHCLSLCSMTRDGDLVTVCDGELYMLFRACRATDADIALRNCFALPPKEIFAETLQFSEVADIEEAVASILPARSFIAAERGRQLLSQSPTQMGADPLLINVANGKRIVAKPVALLPHQDSSIS